MKKDKEIQIVAELLDVLNRHGVDVDTPYVFENFFQDYGTSNVISRILAGDGKKDGDYDDYVEKPITERIARFSRLPTEPDFSEAVNLVSCLSIQQAAVLRLFPETHPCREQTQFVERAKSFSNDLADRGLIDEEDRIIFTHDL